MWVCYYTFVPQWDYQFNLIMLNYIYIHTYNAYVYSCCSFIYLLINRGKTKLGPGPLTIFLNGLAYKDECIHNYALNFKFEYRPKTLNQQRITPRNT